MTRQQRRAAERAAAKRVDHYTVVVESTLGGWTNPCFPDLPVFETPHARYYLAHTATSMGNADYLDPTDGTRLLGYRSFSSLDAAKRWVAADIRNGA